MGLWWSQIWAAQKYRMTHTWFIKNEMERWPTAPKGKQLMEEGHTAWAQLCHSDVHIKGCPLCSIGQDQHGHVILPLPIWTMAETAQVIQSGETDVNLMLKHQLLLIDMVTAEHSPSLSSWHWNQYSSCWIWYTGFQQSPDHIAPLLPECFCFGMREAKTQQSSGSGGENLIANYFFQLFTILFHVGLLPGAKQGMLMAFM